MVDACNFNEKEMNSVCHQFLVNYCNRFHLEAVFQSITLIEYARNHTPITTELLINLSALLMKNTGKEYKTALGDFSSARGELRLLNVTVGVGGRSYMSYNKVPAKLEEFCRQLNADRKKTSGMSIDELYKLTFDAHYNLVTIHPWLTGTAVWPDS